MLPPLEFGNYMATGTNKRNVSQEVFFLRLNLDSARDFIEMDYVNARRFRKPDKTPKSSVYLSTYRVLDRDQKEISVAVRIL